MSYWELLGRVVQHEIDHPEGRLLLTRLGRATQGGMFATSPDLRLCDQSHGDFHIIRGGTSTFPRGDAV